MRGAYLTSAIALLSLHAAAAGPVVSAREGNIYLSANGAEKQLTSGGRDSAPLLAPDKKWVLFVRAIDGKPIESGAGENEPAELWQIRADGKEPTMLLRTRANDDAGKVIAGFDDLQFSSDGRLVFFVTPAWATSGAVHVVNTTNRKERFVVAGHDLEVIQSGQYRDHLILQQHRYFVGGGSYDWFFLFTADGKEVGPIGEDKEAFKELHANG